MGIKQLLTPDQSVANNCLWYTLSFLSTVLLWHLPPFFITNAYYWILLQMHIIEYLQGRSVCTLALWTSTLVKCICYTCVYMSIANTFHKLHKFPIMFWFKHSDEWNNARQEFTVITKITTGKFYMEFWHLNN